MIETYILNTDPLDDDKLFKEKLATVDEKRREKILRLPKGTSQKLSLGAGLLIKNYVGKIESVGKFGKPKGLEREFNISHSGKYVVLTTAHVPVGVDIQILKPGVKKLASRYFTLEECIQIDRSYSPDKTFTQIWAVKEAFLKCLGTGIGKNLKKVSVNLGGKNINVNQKINEDIYFFKEYPVSGYCLAVCCEDNNFEEELIDVTKDIFDINKGTAKK